MKLIMVN